MAPGETQERRAFPARVDLPIDQNLTLSAPFSPSMARASCGDATTQPSSSTIRRIFATCSALLAASFPRPMNRLSSRPDADVTADHRSLGGKRHLEAAGREH